MIRPPQQCPHGHQDAAGRVLVGHVSCSCRGGHTSWTCRECGAAVYAPPVLPPGPAAGIELLDVLPNRSRRRRGGVAVESMADRE
jgi:hypothetical protein